jgi:hypothetical protein
MSRTDKTRPWWVKMAERPMVTCRPQHDHRFGPCTLPERVARIADTVHNGCRECTGYYFRREERRRSRHRSRRELRAYHGDE